MKAFIISRRNYLSAALCLLLLVLIAVVSISAAGSVLAVSTSEKKIPIYCVEKKEKLISISFDAAWGNDDTSQLISILDEYQVKATFFVVGQWVDKYPESVKALAEAGHDIQNHSNTHPHLPALSVSEMTAEINACNDKIEAVTGVRPTLLRAPYGDYNNTLVETLKGMKMYCIQWDVDSLDWKDSATPESITKRVTSKVTNGSIVLFHNDADHTPEALPAILKYLKDDGYQFVLINDLIYKDNYKIDHTGKQISCELNELDTSSVNRYS